MTVSCALPFTTNVTISTSISQTFRTWVANIPSSPAYGILISQLIRYARACPSYEYFILRAVRLSSKLFGQGYVRERLKSSLRKCYGRYRDLIKHYEVPLSQMLLDILGHDHVQWHPQYGISQLTSHQRSRALADCFRLSWRHQKMWATLVTGAAFHEILSEFASDLRNPAIQANS